jgi:DNA-3-methyladenine glycosylase I
MTAYHDREWGVPLKNDRRIFEFLILESFQAGLSWRTILHKRENFRKAFQGFDPMRIARWGAKEKARLLRDAGIVRNRAKIEASIQNARMFLEVQKEFGTFSKYMWGWIGGKPLQHRPRSLKEIPTVIPEAEAWAKDLKKRGFGFLGPTVVYAHMQAAGMVNDHVRNCFRYEKLKA